MAHLNAFGLCFPLLNPLLLNYSYGNKTKQTKKRKTHKKALSPGKRTTCSLVQRCPALCRYRPSGREAPTICPVPLNRWAAAACVFPRGTNTTAGEPQNERSSAPMGAETNSSHLRHGFHPAGGVRGRAAAGTSTWTGPAAKPEGTQRLPQPPCCSRTGSSPPSTSGGCARWLHPVRGGVSVTWPQPTEVTQNVRDDRAGLPA